MRNRIYQIPRARPADSSAFRYGQNASLDVAGPPEEWDAIEKKELAIPDEWSLEEMREFK